MPAVKNLLFRRIWRDPVGASLIAAAIVASVTYVYSRTEVWPLAKGWTAQILALSIAALSKTRFLTARTKSPSSGTVHVLRS